MIRTAGQLTGCSWCRLGWPDGKADLNVPERWSGVEFSLVSCRAPRVGLAFATRNDTQSGQSGRLRKHGGVHTPRFVIREHPRHWGTGAPIHVEARAEALHIRPIGSQRVLIDNVLAEVVLEVD